MHWEGRRHYTRLKLTTNIILKSLTWILTIVEIFAGLEVIFLVHLQSFASNIFPLAEIKFFPNVWATWMILTLKHLLVDIFVTRRLSKALAFCEFVSVNFEPCFWFCIKYSRRDWLSRTAQFLSGKSANSWAHTFFVNSVLKFMEFEFEICNDMLFLHIRYYNWQIAAPMLMSHVIFQRPLRQVMLSI